MSIYRRVLRYYQPFWGKTILGLFLSLIGIGLNLLKPWPFKIIVDDFLRPTPAARSDWSTWVPLLCLALVVIQFAWGIINWITNYLFVKIGLQALLKLRTNLYSHLQRLSLKFHDARRSADSSFRVAYDSQSIQTIYNKGFTNIFASVIALIGTFIVMLRLDWVLTLLSLAIVPLIVGAIYFFALRIRSESTSIQEQESAVLVQAQEGLSSIRMVHAFGREDFEVLQFHQRAQQSLQANLRLTLTNVNSALVISTLMVIGTAAIYYVGTLHVLAGTLSLGSLLVFSAYLLMLYQPLESLTYTAWAMEGATAGAVAPLPLTIDRLRSAGLVLGHTPQEARPRCRLYAMYLRRHGAGVNVDASVALASATGLRVIASGAFTSQRTLPDAASSARTAPEKAATYTRPPVTVGVERGPSSCGGPIRAAQTSRRVARSYARANWEAVPSAALRSPIVYKRPPTIETEE